MKKLTLLLLSVILINSTYSQVDVLHYTDFGTTQTLPTGWSITNGSDVSVVGSNPSSGYTSPNASGGDALYFEDITTAGDDTVLVNPGISTVGYTNISVTWGAYASSSGNPIIKFYWSVNNWSSKNEVVFTDHTEAPTLSTWAKDNGGTQIVLPAGASNAANLQFKFSIAGGVGFSDTYYIDDFQVQASGCSAPTNDPSETVTNITSSSAVLTWTLGADADNTLLVIKEGVAVSEDPVNGTDYSADANSIYGSIGAEFNVTSTDYVIYAGSDGAVTVTGLTSGNVYHYEFFSYNDCSGDEQYKTTGRTGSFIACTAPQTPPTITITSSENTSANLNWTLGADADNILVVIRDGFAVTATPNDDSDYTGDDDPSFIAVGSGLEGSGTDKIVYTGAATSVSVTDLTLGNIYHYTLYSYKNCSNDEQYATGTALTSGTFETCGAPTNDPSETVSNITSSSAVLTWTLGADAENTLLAIKEGVAVSEDPVDGTDYSADASSIYGSVGAEFNVTSTDYVIYAGSDGAVTVTGLTSGNTYHYEFFSYNDCGGNEKYKTTGKADSFIACTAPQTPPTITITSNNVTTANLSWTLGGDADNILVVISDNGAVTATPNDDSDYTGDDDPSFIAAGSGLEGSGTDKIVYAGVANNISVTDLTDGVTYNYTLYSYNNCNNDEQYATGTALASGTFQTCSAPTNDPSETVSNITSSSAVLTWTLGADADNTLIIMKEGTSVTEAPIFDVDYSGDANPVYGSLGSELNITSTDYVIYAGNGGSVTVTGLTEGATYYYEFFSYNSCSGIEKYKTPGKADSFVACADPTTAFTDNGATVDGNEATLSWNSPGDADGYIVVIRDGSAVSTTPTDGNTTITANASFGTTGSELEGSSTDFVVYSGTGLIVTITELQGPTTYHYAIYSFNNCAGDIQYKDVATTGTFTTNNIYYSIAGQDVSENAGWDSDNDDFHDGYNGNLADLNATFIVNDDVSFSTSTRTLDASSKFIIATGSELTVQNTLNSEIDIKGTGQLTIQTATNPTIGTLIGGNTIVEYGTGASSVQAFDYDNLLVSSAVSLGGDVSVADAFTHSAILTLNGNTLTLNGTYTTSSTFTASSASTLSIGGSGGSFGNISFTAGAGSVIGNLIVNRTGSATITLGSNLSITTDLSLTNGDLSLNGKILGLNDASITQTNGTIIGSTTSSIFILGSTGPVGDGLVMNQTGTNNTLSTLRVIRSFPLATDLVIDGKLEMRGGDLTIGSNTLTIDGDYDRFTVGSQLIGSTSSDITVNGTGNFTDPIEFDQSSAANRTVNNFISNASGSVVLGTDMVINTALTINSGKFDNGGFTIDGTGASLSVSSGSTLALGGTTTFPTFGTETIDLNSTILYDGNVQTIAAKDYGNLELADEDASLSIKTLGSAGGTLYGTLAVGSDAEFDFNSQGFTFLSDATSTASLIQSNGDISNTSGIVFQRYISGSSGYKILSAPGSSGSELADFNNEIAMQGFTGSNSPGQSWVSTYFFDETLSTNAAPENGYQAPTDISDPISYLSDQSAIITYFATNAAATTPIPLTADVSGLTLSTGSKPYIGLSLTETGYHMLGNPYPCPVNWDNVTLNDIQGGAVYILEQTGDGNFATYNQGDGAVISSCEGFVVQVSVTNASIIFNEDDKVSTGDDFNRLATQEIPSLEISLTTPSTSDNTRIRFNNNSNIGFDSKDANKFDNIYGYTNIALVAEGHDLVWNYVPEDVNGSFPIRIYTNYYQNIVETYTVDFNNVSQLLQHNKCIVFQDTEAGISFPLTSDTSYTFTMSDTVTVPRLFLNIESPIETTYTDATCFESYDGSISVSNTSSNYTFTWYDQAGNTIPNSSSSLNFVGAGMYTVEVSGLNGICSTATSTVEIIEPNDFEVTESISDIICFGDNTGEISLSAFGGQGTSFTYFWSNGNSTETLTNATAGNYNVTITDEAGCQKVELFSIAENPMTSLTTIVSDASCYGEADGSIDLNAYNSLEMDFTYNWSNGADTEDIFDLSYGQYDLTVTDSLGCETHKSILVEEPLEIIAAFEASNDTLIINDGAIAIFNNYTIGSTEFSWEFGDGSTSTDNSPWHEYTTVGNYEVVLTAGSGSCLSSYTSTIVVQSISGIENLAVKNAIKYTETDGILFVVCEDFENSNILISVFNPIGQLIETKESQANNGMLEIELPQTTGAYIIKLETNNNQFVKKHIVTKTNN